MDKLKVMQGVPAKISTLHVQAGHEIILQCESDPGAQQVRHNDIGKRAG